MKYLLSLVLFSIVQLGIAQSEIDVLARYYDSGSQKKYWYKGTITQQRTGKVFVRYNDGDTKWHSNFYTVVPFITVQAIGGQVEAGDRVLARYYDSGYKRKYWYLGTITKIDSDGKLFVEYDDGDTKWHGNYNTLVLFKPLSMN